LVVKWNDDARQCRSRPRSSGTGRSARSPPSPGIRTLCALCPQHGDMRGWHGIASQIGQSLAPTKGTDGGGIECDPCPRCNRVTVEEQHYQTRAWLFESAASKRSRGRWSSEHGGRSARGPRPEDDRTTAKQEGVVVAPVPFINSGSTLLCCCSLVSVVR
jgi:hypothetical protein